jgi:prolyl oligopeptidase
MTRHYPPTKRTPVIDDYHGTLVADPYRWLENAESPETRQWVEAQNALTSEYLDGIAEREKLRARLHALWDFPRRSVSTVRGDRSFFTHNDGLQDQPVLMCATGRSTTVLLDPNVLSDDGATALIGRAPSDDGSLLAYTLAEAGSDWQTARVLDTTTGSDLGDELHWLKFTNLAWLPDASGFFYARYPAPGEVPKAPPSTHHRVYLHRLGTPQEEDRLVYARPDDPDLGFEPAVTDDGRYLVFQVWRGTDTRTRFYYRALSDDGEFIRLLDAADAKYIFIDHVDGRFYFLTDLDAPMGRVVAIDPLEPSRVVEIVPEQEDTLSAAIVVSDHLVLLRERHAQHVVEIHELDGSRAGTIRLPAPGSIVDWSGRRTDRLLYLGFQSFFHPPMVLRYAFESDTVDTVWAPEVPFDPATFTTEQLFATSGDGTRIPMFVTRHNDTEFDGCRPTVLYGYGGFDISLTPTFDPGRIAFLEAGGVFAVANLRGGGEYGREWHEAGMLEKKQNVFDDFTGCAEYLIAKRITTPHHLGILGRSNGGLLVLACSLQRPDLFAATVAGVPVADMLRYHRFTAGRYWTPEYGNAEDDPDHFRFLFAYSPLHNVVPGQIYPPTLITTAESDDRVVPMHAYKLAATMQASADPTNPVLLRVETRAGHGLGKPVTKLIEEATDVYGFLLHHLRNP